MPKAWAILAPILSPSWKCFSLSQASPRHMVSACVQKFIHSDSCFASSPSPFCCPGGVAGHSANTAVSQSVAGWGGLLLWPFKFMVRPSLHPNLKPEPWIWRVRLHLISYISLSSSSEHCCYLEKDCFFFIQKNYPFWLQIPTDWFLQRSLGHQFCKLDSKQSNLDRDMLL